MAQRKIHLYLIPESTLSPSHGRTYGFTNFQSILLSYLVYSRVLCLLFTKAPPQPLLQHLSTLNSHTAVHSGVTFETEVQTSGCSVVYYKLCAALI